MRAGATGGWRGDQNTICRPLRAVRQSPWPALVPTEAEISARRSAPLASILGNWTVGGGPLHRRLAESMKVAIEQGDLPRGRFLPPEREVARQLSVSRNTVSNAWQTLKSDGLIGSRRGSGTWIMASSAAADESPLISLRGVFHSGDPIDFTSGQLEGTQSIVDIVRSLDEDDLTKLIRRQRLSPAGLPELRRAIADYFTAHEVITYPEQVMVVTGFQQAIALVAALYIRQGDVAVIEDPVSPAALDVLRAAGARLRGVQVAEDGIDIDELTSQIAAGPKLVYLIPTFHNPTGTVLDISSRRRVAQLSAELNVPVVDDLTRIDIGFEDPPPPLAHYRPDAPIISLGSMSKLFWSGLRIGWVRAPEPIIARLMRMKTVADLGSSVLSQLIAARLLDQLAEVKASRQRELGERMDCLAAGLRKHLPEWQWLRPRGGLALWVKIPTPTAIGFAQLALRHGVAVVAGPALSPNDRHADRLVLCFHLPPLEIDEGIRRLSHAWRSHVRCISRS